MLDAAVMLLLFLGGVAQGEQKQGPDPKAAAVRPPSAPQPGIDMRLQLRFRTLERDIAQLQLLRAAMMQQIAASCPSRETIENQRTQELECVPLPEK
jgi:hypothetical protein